jgi:protein TonB
MGAIRERGDLILGAIVAAALHGALLFSFPWTPSAARLDGRPPGPVEISLRGPELPLAPPAPQAVRETPPPPLERKRVEKKAAPPVKEEVGERAPKTPAAEAVREVPEAPPESDSSGAARESVAAEAVAAHPARELPEAAGTPALTRQAVHYRDNPAPPYPGPARRRGHEGTVYLAVEVLAGGTTGRIRVERSSGHPILDDAALQAVREWRFEPAMKNGIPVASWVEVPIRFVLGSPEKP